MSIIVPLQGCLNILDDFLAVENRVIRLFKANITPVQASVIGTFTAAGVEADYSGYASQGLAAAAWSPSVSDGAGRAISTNAILSWLNTTGAVGNLIYGYWVTDPAGNLLWAERFPAAPIDMTLAGKLFYFVPVLTFRSEF